jgi:hypothetical protein
MVVEVSTIARQARIRPRDGPVLLEQTVGEFHRHVPTVASGFALIGARGPGLAIMLYFADGQPFPMAMSVAVGCR